MVITPVQETNFARQPMKTIEDRIARTPIAELVAKFGPMPLDPYPYQWAAYEAVAECLRKYPGPVVVEAAVSAGKTIMISMLARRIVEMNQRALVISRQAEIVDQDATELWNFDVKNSVFCAGLNKKSSHYPVVCGSEKTVANAIDKKLKDFTPMFLVIDECHQVNIDDLIASDTREFIDEDTGETLLTGETLEEMIEAKRNSYTIIIRELQRRCQEVHGTRLRVIGYTGTPYRGTDSIINEDYDKPGFWRKTVIRITTPYLVKVGSVVPTFFGATSLGYDLSAFDQFKEEGTTDFSDEQLKAMQRQIMREKDLTHAIMAEVHQLTKRRNGVLVTCSGVDHCYEAASALPEGTSYAIITEKTTTRDRMDIIAGAKSGAIKFVFQVMALTTGVNVPPWDTSVILRRISSLTLLVQLLGRGMRILKKEHIAAGMTKKDHLVLDYSGTMAAMGSLFEDPILEDYVYQSEQEGEKTKECPDCYTMNTEKARRCSGIVNGERCWHFFQSKECEDDKDPSTGRVLRKGCGAENDIVAKNCRCCGKRLIDFNKNLSGQHYTEGDYCNVVSWEPQVGNGGSFAIQYNLEKDGIEFKAWEIHWLNSKNPGAYQVWKTFINTHVFDESGRKTLRGCRTPEAVLKNIHYVMQPKRVTHRKTGGGKDTINKKVF